MGAHVRLHEEPERHVWQGEVGTAAHPWLADHRIHNVAALPGAAYCEMACAAARTVLGEEFEVRDIRFEATLLLDDETPVSAVASVTSPGVVDFAVETFGDGAQIRRATAVLHAGGDDDQPPAYDMPALLAAHPCRAGWGRDAEAVRRTRPAVWSGFRRTGRGAQRGRDGRHSAGRGQAARPHPLATGRLRRASRLAGCLFPVGCGSPRRPGRR